MARIPDPATLARQQHGDDPSDVVRLTDSSQRGLGCQQGFEFGRQAATQLGTDRPGRDGVGSLYESILL
jgi:hypothetical protein